MLFFLLSVPPFQSYNMLQYQYQELLLSISVASVCQFVVLLIVLRITCFHLLSGHYLANIPLILKIT